jgi:hypothetical protein
MTTLLLWAAKRAVVYRIQSASDSAQPTDPLYGLQIAYSLPPDPERICIYGGRVRSSRSQSTGEHALMFREDATVEVRVRVFEAGADVQDAESVAESIAQRIAAAVSADPRIVIGSVAVSAVDSDPAVLVPDPEPGVIVNVGLTVSLAMQTPGA